MSAYQHDTSFVDRLGRLAQRTSKIIKGRATRRSLGEGLKEGLKWIWVFPVGFCLYRLARAWIGNSPELPHWAWLVGLTIAVPLLWALGTAVMSRLQRISRRQALATVDQDLGLSDRLQTADEFLERGPRNGFELAAVEDAQGALDKAEQSALELQDEARSDDRRNLIVPVLAAASALAIAILVHRNVPQQTTLKAEVDPEDLTAAVLPDRQPLRENTPPEVVKETPRENPRQGERLPPGPPRTEITKPAKASKPLKGEMKESQGMTRSGESADASSSSGASNSKGTPSQQAQASKPSDKKSKEGKKSKKDSKPKPSEANEPKPEEDSGATSGRGAATGSNKSPAASPWSSKDQVTSEDEEDIEDDEEVDDEFDNSDARGGVQPGLRDRRPPVNRDLSIGFGNGKNPDANGRGGPGEQKKSRGVASLVLGTPIPDHIKGRPNPGKTKITQERVEPQEESSTPFTSSPRTSRDTPVGHMSKPELSTWMRNLIRSYYLNQRKPTP